MFNNILSSSSLHYDLMYLIQNEISREQICFYIGVIGIIVTTLFAFYKHSSFEMWGLLYVVLFNGFGVLSFSYFTMQEFKKTQEYILQQDVMQNIKKIEDNLLDYIKVEPNKRTIKGKDYENLTYVLIMQCNNVSLDYFSICIKENTLKHLYNQANQKANQ